MKIILLLALTLSLIADIIEFKNGAVVTGKVTKQTDTTVSINVADKTTTYAKSDVKNIKLDTVVSAPPPPPPPVVSTGQITLKAGTSLHVKSLSTISTSSHQTGHQFEMLLENNIMNENSQILVPKGAMLYGVVEKSQSGGRLFGKSEMIISLTAIEINAKRIVITTNKINILAPQSEGQNSVRKVARGAAIGALVDGHEGARTGAKVGVGAAILTRGRATGVPAGTLLDFRLSENVKF